MPHAPPTVRREVALRLALGASRNRILRQLFTEAVLISLIGGASDCGQRRAACAAERWQPFPGFPDPCAGEPGRKSLCSRFAVGLGERILFGLVPVRQVLRTDPYQIIKAGSTGRVGRRITVRDVLLVVQIAICAVLVTSSMVAVRGLVRSLHGNFGFEPRNAMLVNTDLSMAGYSGDKCPPCKSA